MFLQQELLPLFRKVFNSIRQTVPNGNSVTVSLNNIDLNLNDYNFTPLPDYQFKGSKLFKNLLSVLYNHSDIRLRDIHFISEYLLPELKSLKLSHLNDKTKTCFVPIIEHIEDRFHQKVVEYEYIQETRQLAGSFN